MPRNHMEQLHRHLIRFIALDLIIIALIVVSLLSSWSASQKLFALILSVILFPLGIATVVSMFKRTHYGIILGISSLSLIGSAFLLIGLIEAWGSMTQGDSGFLQGLLLLLLGAATLRRVPTMRNPVYAQWYGSNALSDSGGLANGSGEMLATCPGCSSILAIYPNRMTPADRCPSCNSKLVFYEEE